MSALNTMAVVEAEAAPEAAGVAGTIKNIALLLVAPFIGLAYAIAFPFVAIGVLAWLVGKELAQIKVARLAAAPFAGLALLAVLPFAGIAMLAWVGIGGEMPQALALGSTL
jgi:hypothetical protein